MVPDVSRPSVHHPQRQHPESPPPPGCSSCLGTHQRRFDIQNCHESFSHGAAGSSLNHRVLYSALCKSSWAEPILHYGPEQIPLGRPGFAPRPLCRAKWVFFYFYFYWEIVIKTSSSLGYASALPTGTALCDSFTTVWPLPGPAVSVNNVWNLPVSLVLKTKYVSKTPTTTTFLLNWRGKFCLLASGKSIMCDILRAGRDLCN